MSSVEKLSIQGIRSFGQDDGDRQVIQFFHPLTLIVGQNGAGKTTIIECLKYICSGEFPPGSKGAAFIHDPKVAHETEVKAQVKLRFKDKAGKDVVVTRSLVATQKIKKIEFKSLEGTILRVDNFGEKHSISSRCAEIDREMVESLGVSKPVLSNVIFCHQEDANWPLSDGKTLKGKFDEIFAATRYIKALETIRKLRTEQSGQIREYILETRHLKDWREKAKQLSRELDDKKARLEAAEGSVTKINDQLKPVEEQYDDLVRKSYQITKLANEVAKNEGEKDQLIKGMKSVEDQLEIIFQGSVDELRRIYSAHQSKITEKEHQLQENEGKKRILQESAQRTSSEKSKLLVIQGVLQQEAQQQQETIRRRDHRMRGLATQLHLLGYSETGEFTSSRAGDFMEEVKEWTEAQRGEAERIKIQHEEKEKGVDKQSQDLRATYTGLETTIKMKMATINDNTSKLREIKGELSTMGESSQRLKELENEKKTAESELTQLEGSLNVDDIKQEIDSLQREAKQYDKRMSQLTNELTTISSQSQARAKLEMMQKEKTIKENQIRSLRGKRDEEMLHLLGHFPSENIRTKLSNYLVEKTEEVKRCNNKLQHARMDLSAKQANKKTIMDQLKKKEDELRSNTDQLMSACGSEDIDESIQQITQSINSLQNERGALTGSKHLFDRYIQSLQRTDALCPLCHRGFDSGVEVQELVQELQDKLRLAPSKLAEKERTITKQREKSDRLLVLRPIKDAAKKLSEREIPDLKLKLSAVNADIEKLNATVMEAEDNVSMLQVDEAMARDMKPDIQILEKTLTELRDLERKIGEQSKYFSGSDISRTLQQVNTETAEVKIKLNTVRSTLELKQRQRQEHVDNVNMMRISINSITSETLRLSAKLQKREKLESEQAELSTNTRTFQREIEDSRQEQRPIKDKLQKLAQDKVAITQKKESEIKEIREKIDEVQQQLRDIRAGTSNIAKYVTDGKESKLDDVEVKIMDLNEKLTKLGEDLSLMTATIEQLKDDISNQKVKEMELGNNMRLKKYQQEVEKKSGEIEKLQEKLGGYNLITIEREKTEMEKKKASLNREKNQLDGRSTELRKEVTRQERELESDSYKNAEKNYNDMMIKCRTTEIANKDLDKYYNALNSAINTYHSQKMSEINKIVRDLWRMTYKGSDIDFIEICADDETGASTTQRRQYNYRVVMVKGDTALDMRGRCSAGQKVLASLLIRLALAETFCLSCGILALDEPTTNLDRDNIESLAHALVDILKSRENQRNFQLLIITHDEEFVELLGHSDYTDNYYRVTKNNDYKSTVVKYDIATLQATQPV
ncbi:DNA repair protein RAD50 [Strongylocentrotus purpuratus]|uniref:Zinc-hook domain-containing protein n=1 Tax=Strongylocentrotus purpuratus TaxID=7668 RepID=A0A7M7NMW0_STRPU|nr:DNA repair protein RAD50 [Strongylocentrotus purpuratus]